MLDPGKQTKRLKNLVCYAPLDSCQLALFSTPIFPLSLSMAVPKVSDDSVTSYIIGIVFFPTKDMKSAHSAESDVKSYSSEYFFLSYS